MSNYFDGSSDFAPGRTGMAVQTYPVESLSIGSEQQRKQAAIQTMNLKKQVKPNFKKLKEQKSRLQKGMDTTQESRTASPFQESPKRQVEIQVESPIGKKGQQYFAALNKRMSQTKVNSPERSPKNSEEKNRTIKLNDGKSGTQSRFRGHSGQNSLDS